MILGGNAYGLKNALALSRKKATTIALDPEDDRLLSRAARERGTSPWCLNSTDDIPGREARALSER